MIKIVYSSDHKVKTKGLDLGGRATKERGYFDHARPVLSSGFLDQLASAINRRPSLSLWTPTLFKRDSHKRTARTSAIKAEKARQRAEAQARKGARK